MKKKVLAMLLSVVMAVSVLTGCGGSDASSAPAGDSAASGSEAANNSASADSGGVLAEKKRN